MCGISVVLGAPDPSNRQRLARMHEPIRHRGPDGEGFLFVDEDGRARRHASWPADAAPVSLGIAFRRLKILDLSEAAAQPLGSTDGRFWIVFNGEIYNYRALRGELAARGRVFRSSGDTEVALAAYEAWGEDCFARLDGMWAIVLVDLARGRVLASRDRFGIKPLYWSRHGDRLLLASEIKQVLAVRGERPRAHAPLVARYLRGTRLPCLEESFFQGVRAVPPATWFEVPLSAPSTDPRFRAYWDLADFRCPDPAHPTLAYPEALEQFRGLLCSAVESHAEADVTVGSLLSGGLDSSTLVSLLRRSSRARGDRVPTFSFGVPDAAPGQSELPYVDALVRRDTLENHRAGFDAAWIAAHAPRAVRAMEEPPLALPALAQYRVFQLCREHDTTVVLDGQAADEVLGGYPYYQRTLLIDRLRHGRLADFTRELRHIARRSGRSSARLLLPLVMPLVTRRRRDLPGLAPDYGMDSDPGELRRAQQDRGRDPSWVNRQLHYDVRWGNVKIVLGYSDKNAMAHSVEARVPYLDRRLVESSFSQPDHYKVGNGDRKRLLRDVARDLLPPEITERRDRLGFLVPERELLGGALWPEARELILGGGLLRSACFDAAGAHRFVESFGRQRSGDVRVIWRLYALALWTREFDVALG